MATGVGAGMPDCLIWSLVLGLLWPWAFDLGSLVLGVGSLSQCN